MDRADVASLADERDASEKLLFGHPRGLLFLSFTEAWERFSFYGMRGLLVLYLVQQLLLPGHVEHVAGMAGFRAAVESVTGPLSTQAFASQLFGLYAGLVYLTPIFGGIIADRWLGAKATVLIGIALMTAGHLLMAFEWSVLIALMLLILGSGCLKGNIAAQVGHLYPHDDEARRARGYTLFSTGINIGGMIGPLVCGVVAQVYGWDVGFGVAGLFVLLAAIVYLAGLRHFAPDRPRGRQREITAALSAPEWQMIGMIFLVLGLGLTQTFAYDLQFNTGFIFLAERVDLATPFGQVPEAWFAAEDSFASVIIVPVLIGLWRWQEQRGKGASELGKIAFGGVLQMLAMLCLAAGDLLSGGGKVSIVWPIATFMLSGFAFMYQWPTLLSLVSRRSPAKAVSLLMALTYTTGFVSGVVTGALARFYELMPNWQFWLWSAALAVSGSIAIWLCEGRVNRRMDRLDAQRVVPVTAGVPAMVPLAGAGSPGAAQAG